MRKLTFERAIIIVLAMIIFISTTEIREKYTGLFLDKFFPKDSPVSTDVQSGKNRGFPTMLLSADNLYKEGDYEGAAEKYFTLSLNSALSPEQKSRANFRLGICQYNLKKYQLAFQSFLNTANFSPNDSIIYNNAAVSAYKANDMKSAIKYQTKALEIRPAVEYYYNLARMYEDNEQYDQSVNNYLAVAIAEQNLTETDKIDPVRVKEKLTRLVPSSQVSEVSKVLIAYKLNSTNSNINEVLTIDENEMQLKQGTFTIKVENAQDVKNIIAQYDRKKYDPYNLITELIWTIYKDKKEIYKRASDKISFSATDGGNYEIRLNIKYNGTEKLTTKTVTIKENQSTINDGKSDEVVVKPPSTEISKKYYMDSIYEQLFEGDYKANFSSFTDKYSIVWGKDSGVDLSHNKKLFVDKASSLNVNNTTDKDAGLWINLDSLLKNENIKGKTVIISFYGRKITDNAEVFVSARVKTNNMIATTKRRFILPYQFDQKSIRVYIPEDANGFTVSIKTIANEQFNIDSFTITN